MRNPGCPAFEEDLWADNVLADPYPTYRTLRDLGPVVWLAKQDIAVLPRYTEVRAALTDWKSFTSAKGACIDDDAAVEMGETILSSDPPIHTGYRKPMADQLSLANLAGDVASIEAVAAEFTDRLVTAGTFDAVSQLSSPYSVKVVSDLVGLSDEGRDRIGALGERAFNTMGPRDTRNIDGGAALSELAAITYADIANLCPGSQGAKLVAAGHSGALLAYTWPGIDTTVHAISSIVFEFARHPDQWDLVRADPSLVPSAFNEVLRLHTPVQTFARVTTTAVRYGDVELPADTRVGVMFGSANRDERQYADPDRFDVTRNPVDHLAFGRGIHLCVGINLARIEAHSLLKALAQRVKRFELAGEPTWKLNNTLHGLGSLPVRAIAA
jgi:cytochrome P450